jgi:hypothetical protein
VLLSSYGNVPSERTANLIGMLLGIPVSPGFVDLATERLDSRLQAAGFDYVVAIRAAPDAATKIELYAAAMRQISARLAPCALTSTAAPTSCGQPTRRSSTCCSSGSGAGRRVLTSSSWSMPGLGCCSSTSAVDRLRSARRMSVSFGRTTQNSFPSGSARTVQDSAPVCPMSTRRAPSARPADHGHQRRCGAVVRACRQYASRTGPAFHQPRGPPTSPSALI